MLLIQNLTFSYSRKRGPVIKDFSLDIDHGGVYGLLGSNGVGKSTLLYLISGLLTPSSGRVLLDDVNTRLRLPDIISQIFLVPEEFDFPSMTLKRYIELNSGFYPNFSQEEMFSNLELFEIDPDQHLGGPSMGQKKKIALSFAMACNTPVLLLDEPTNGLDIPGKAAFRRFISRVADEKRIIIISTHQVRDVAQILDQVLIIDKQRVLFNHSVAEIQSRLKFMDTLDRSLIDSALFAMNAPQGSSVILPNYDGNDTEINLELLFTFAHNDPQSLNNIFNSKSTIL